MVASNWFSIVLFAESKMYVKIMQNKKHYNMCKSYRSRRDQRSSRSRSFLTIAVAVVRREARRGVGQSVLEI